jgi:hypothetical protein
VLTLLILEFKTRRPRIPEEQTFHCKVVNVILVIYNGSSTCTGGMGYEHEDESISIDNRCGDGRISGVRDLCGNFKPWFALQERNGA